MDKKIIIASVIEAANGLEDNGFTNLANRLTDIAKKISFDFNNPEKEMRVNDSLALEEDHFHNDYSAGENIFKDLLVDDSLANDMDDDITSFDEENEGLDSHSDTMTFDDWNGLYHKFIVDGDITRSQIEDALAVVLSKNDHFHDKTSAVLKYMTKYSEKKSSVIKLSQALKNMEKMFGEDMKKLG